MGRRSLRATSNMHLTRLVRLGLNPVGIGAIIGCLLTAKTLSRIDLRFSPKAAAIHHLQNIRKGTRKPGGFATILQSSFLSCTGRVVYSPSGLDGRGAPAVMPRVNKAAIKGRNLTILTAMYVLEAVLSVECLSSGGNASKNEEDEHDLSLIHI